MESCLYNIITIMSLTIIHIIIYVYSITHSLCLRQLPARRSSTNSTYDVNSQLEALGLVFSMREGFFDNIFIKCEFNFIWNKTLDELHCESLSPVRFVSKSISPRFNMIYTLYEICLYPIWSNIIISKKSIRSGK